MARALILSEEASLWRCSLFVSAFHSYNNFDIILFEREKIPFSFLAVRLPKVLSHCALGGARWDICVRGTEFSTNQLNNANWIEETFLLDGKRAAKKKSCVEHNRKFKYLTQKWANIWYHLTNFLISLSPIPTYFETFQRRSPNCWNFLSIIG